MIFFKRRRKKAIMIKANASVVLGNYCLNSNDWILDQNSEKRGLFRFILLIFYKQWQFFNLFWTIHTTLIDSKLIHVNNLLYLIGNFLFIDIVLIVFHVSKVDVCG